MVSASILAVGMVLVARGLLTASSTLQTVENRVAAYAFLDEKLMALQQQAMEEGGLGPAHEAGSTDFSGRPVAWSLDIEPVTLSVSGGLPADPSGAPPTGQPVGGAGTISGVAPKEPAGGVVLAEPELPDVSFAQVRLRAAWQEANRTQDAVLITYVGYKAPPGEIEGREEPS